MPSPRRRLRAADVERFVREQCFAPAQQGLVGIELEQLTVAAGDPAACADHARVRAAVATVSPLAGGSRLTFEPGGQVELSSAPLPGVTAACAALTGDLATVCDAVAGAGARLLAAGLDPWRDRSRVVEEPRYRAMEAYFRSDGDEGARMMCSTAALQVNLDIGEASAQARRWHLAHALGPTLVASFANSPLSRGAPTGRRSERAAICAALDPSRSGPAETGTADPAGAWLQYALEAQVMLIRTCAERFHPMATPLPFGRWMEEGHELGFPVLDDFEYHLGTLFPPVRPRGWLELRMVDSLPDPWWQAAAAVVAALFDDPEAADEAARASAATAGLWADAARHGLSHPGLALAAATCFRAALDALPRLGADEATISAVGAFFERFVARGRCPADDLLDAWRRHGRLLPDPLPLESSWT
ncbi:MAG: ergothioneine biosynthesis glutamate--cysteine ligase EgtA [Actinobacteria bacterium]|nr:ergothioneine biosynthesis glutamate--cysteine ligase EgtA [Actinomycetota bacterium]